MDIALHSLDSLPAADEQHEIVRIDVSEDGPDRFALTFVTADGRSLRVRLPSDHLLELARVLLALAAERHLAQ
jgi:hypothetical protein